jgi:flagellar motor component MotA
MFLIPGGMLVTGVHTIHSVNPASLLTFWGGVAILIGAILISRRKREIPFQPMRRFVPVIAKRAALAMTLVGLLVLVTSVLLAVISTVSLGQSTVTQQPASVRIETDYFLWKGTLTTARRRATFKLLIR